jgi:hypothetical protein
VRNLKAFNVIPVGHLNPAFQLSKVEGIFIALSVNIHELNCRALAFRRCVKGRSKNGGEQEIKTMLHSGLNIALDYLPVPFAENLHTVIGGKAVRMKPVCVFKLLLGQQLVGNTNGNLGGFGFFSDLYRNIYLIFGGFNLLIRLDFKPNAVPALCGRKFGILRNGAEKGRDKDRSRRFSNNSRHGLNRRRALRVCTLPDRPKYSL